MDVDVKQGAQPRPELSPPSLCGLCIFYDTPSCRWAQTGHYDILPTDEACQGLLPTRRLLATVSQGPKDVASPDSSADILTLEGEGRGDVETKANIRQLVKEEALEDILKDPGLLHRVKLDLDRRITGEDKNKLSIWNVGASALLRRAKRTLGAIVLGESSAGKSHLINEALRGFEYMGRILTEKGEDNDLIKDFTRMTQASPDRIGEDYTGKILKVQELKGIEAAQTTVRVWISEGCLNLLAAERDAKDGKIKTLVIKTTGVPAFLTTSTTESPDPELLNRILILSIDESMEQTRRILEYEAEEYETPKDDSLDPYWNLDKPLYDTLKRLRTAECESRHVLIPFASRLAQTFPCHDVRARRDFKKLLNLIYVIAWVHQFQRPIAKVKDGKIGKYVIALAVDFWLARRIIDEGMRETLLGVQSRALKVLACFKDDPTVMLTAAQVATKTGYSQRRGRELLKALVERGYCIEDDERRPYKYYIKEKLETNAISDFASVLGSFQEEEFKAFLDTNNLNVLSGEYTAVFVDPITGERSELLFPQQRTLEKVALKQEKTVEGEKEPKENAKSQIALPSKETTSITRLENDGNAAHGDNLFKETEMTRRKWRTCGQCRCINTVNCPKWDPNLKVPIQHGATYAETCTKFLPLPATPAEQLPFLKTLVSLKTNAGGDGYSP